MAAGRIKSASGRLWEACIGLEVHAQISCRTKLFSSASAETVPHARPNSQVALVDAAMPGTLPVLNKQAVAQAVRTGLALGSRINPASYFERKHYFYCDLPQGYQITQQASPIATGGVLMIEAPVHENQKNRKGKGVSGEGDWESANIRINRIQLEQDSGKSVHDARAGVTLVDLNRAGTALMEIVFEPDITSPPQAGEAVRTLQRTLRQLGTCDGNMEDGSIRCDLNVSVREVGGGGPGEAALLQGERVEVKNVNSIKGLETAAQFEIRRQIECYEKGVRVVRETRTYDAVAKATRRMRGKEGAVDYRFFPEPDLPPLLIEETDVEELRRGMPELPSATRKRLMEVYGLSAYDAAVLVGEGRDAVSFFEELARGREAKTAANWIINDLFGLIKEQPGGGSGGVYQSPVTVERLGAMIDLVASGRISVRTAKDVLAVMMIEDHVSPPESIVQERQWEQISDRAVLRGLAERLVADPASDRQLRQYKRGKGQMLKYFVGQAMKATDGRANPEMVEGELRQVLDETQIDGEGDNKK